MRGFWLFVVCISGLHFIDGRITVRDIQQAIESNPVEELQQLLTGAEEQEEEQVGRLSDVGPETNLVEDETEEEQVGDDAAQQPEEAQQENVDIQQENLDAQQQVEDNGLIYEITGPDATDLVKIELNREQCNEESVIKCFESLNESIQHEDPERFCQNARSAVDCITELVDICAEGNEQREHVQEYLDLMNNEVKYLCGNPQEDEAQEQLDAEAKSCMEEKIGYDIIFSRCGPETAEKLGEREDLMELTHNDIMCLSYKYTAACTTTVAEEICGKSVGNLVYSQLINAIDRFDAMKESSFCQFNEDQDQQETSQNVEDASQEQEPIQFDFSLIRKRRAVV